MKENLFSLFSRKKKKKEEKKINLKYCKKIINKI